MSQTLLHYPGEVLEKTELSLEWSDMRNLTYHPRVARPRSKGVHVSGIIKVIAEKRKLYKPGDELDDMPTVVLLGQAFEEQAARLYSDLEWQPGEVQREGVAGNPDGRSPLFLPPNMLSTGAVCVGRLLEEFKLTYKSNRYRQDIRAEQTWMMQVMDYLWMDELTYRADRSGMQSANPYMSIGEWFYARLHVLWACADYIQPFRPTYIRYLIRFTEQELKTNWAMMMKFKQFAVKE